MSARSDLELMEHADGELDDGELAARIARDYDGRYGAADGPASASAFVATLYRGAAAR